MIETQPSRTAVLLLPHGTANSLDHIPEFLRNVTGGRPLPPQVIEEVKHSYSLIGHSPMNEITARQRELLARELDLPVYVGMGTAESLSSPWASYAITSKCFTILISPSRTLPGSTTCVFGAPNL